MQRKRRWMLVMFLVALCMITGCGVNEKDDESSDGRENGVQKTKNSFSVPDMDELEFGEPFEIADYYITNKLTVPNHYFIDAEKVLWGNGFNEHGQLALNKPEDTGNLENRYEEYVKIAEDVVHVDCSINGYFMIYLTEDGKLYGVGENLKGVLLEEPVEYDSRYTFMEHGKSVVYTPKLLMEDVAYARAGKDSVTVLLENGDVYWWGEFCSTSVSSSDVEIMCSTEPVLMVQNAQYATSGNWTAAAITEDNELYTWGWNTWGTCGVDREEDYICQAQKVLDGVAMVWPEQMLLNSPQEMINGSMDVFAYDYENTFIRLLDGTYMACGKNIGNKQKTIQMSGDQLQEETATCSWKFVPIEVVEEK